MEKIKIDSEKIFNEFWKDIICNPDGSLNAEQVKKELADFHYIMDQVPKVYCHVTGDTLSKLMYEADTVINCADNHLNEQIENANKELTEELKVTDDLLKERQKVIDLIPECQSHGGNCIPNAIDWIKAAKELMDENSKLLANIAEWEPEIKKVLDAREPKKRYFIVFYRLFRVGGGFNYWYANVDSEGEYLNYGETTVKIKDRLNEDIEKEKSKVESILITNIIELNESDYKDWVK